MALYKNRGGRVLNLDQHSPVIIRRIAAGELTLVKKEKREVVQLKKKEVKVAKVEIESKKELTDKYIEKFGKKPFAGWNETKLQEKINEVVGE